jgi:hypothetical protein
MGGGTSKSAQQVRTYRNGVLQDEEGVSPPTALSGKASTRAPSSLDDGHSSGVDAPGNRAVAAHVATPDSLAAPATLPPLRGSPVKGDAALASALNGVPVQRPAPAAPPGMGLAVEVQQLRLEVAGQRKELGELRQELLGELGSRACTTTQGLARSQPRWRTALLLLTCATLLTLRLCSC